MRRECLQSPFSIGDIGRCHRYRMGQTLCIDGDMALDTRYFFTRVIAFMCRGIRVLDTLRINDYESRVNAPSTVDAGLANRIFLKPAPAGLIRLRSACLSIA